MQNNPQILIQNCSMGNMDKYFKCNTENPHRTHVLAWITRAVQSNYINYSVSSMSVIKTPKFFYSFQTLELLNILVSESAIHSALTVSFGIPLTSWVSESLSVGFLLSCLAVGGT